MPLRRPRRGAPAPLESSRSAVPRNRASGFSRSDQWAGHVRRYTRGQSSTVAIAAAGFEILTCKAWGFPISALYHRTVFEWIVARHATVPRRRLRAGSSDPSVASTRSALRRARTRRPRLHRRCSAAKQVNEANPALTPVPASWSNASGADYPVRNKRRRPGWVVTPADSIAIGHGTEEQQRLIAPGGRRIGTSSNDEAVGSVPGSSGADDRARVRENRGGHHFLGVPV